MRSVFTRNSIIAFAAALVLAFSGGTAKGQGTAQMSGTIRDTSGLAVPSAEIKATNTGTGAARNITADANGSYTLPNLAIGPYSLEVAKDGFAKYIQAGIVLQVDSNPTVDVTLKIGSVNEQVTVQADVAQVETHSTGIGTVVDNQRVVELPLNGRNATELIFLAGMAVVSPGNGLNSPRNYPTPVFAVAGGVGVGISYQLDGTNHNDAVNNLNLPLPFPDALQEFKVETSALPAQYGLHGAAAVNAITKSGTNQFHGGLFEFLRNGDLNSRDFFAATRDTLKRNQFGGVIGGPIKKDKLFFFAGYQGTIIRSTPPQSIAYVPTTQMVNGDFSSFATCNNKTLPLAQGFTNNQISTSLLNPVALKIAASLPATTDPCGKVTFGLVSNSTENFGIMRLDYQKSSKHSLYLRYLLGNLFVASTYDGKNPLTANAVASDPNRAISGSIGDTYLIGSNMVNSFRVGVNRTIIPRPGDNIYSLSDLGASNFTPLAGKTLQLSVTGNGFAIGGGNAIPVTIATGPNFNFAEEVNWVKGNHQLGFGANYLRNLINNLQALNSGGAFTFNGSVTGLGLSDFLLGNVATFVQNGLVDNDYRQLHIGLYAQDSWKIHPRVTVNYGLRWEPYLAPWSKSEHFSHFDSTLFAQNVHSTVYPNAPAGMIYAGDSQYTIGNHPERNIWDKFLPRVGLVWDPAGKGQMTIRAAFGMFTDGQHLAWGYYGFGANSPFGNSISLTNVNLSNPWATYPGGNPYPFTLNKNTPFPLAGSYRTDPFNYKQLTENEWNVSVQKQFGANWLVTANYVGTSMIHLASDMQLNPAIFLGLGPCSIPGPKGTVNTYSTCSTTANTNQRRLLYLQNPDQGQYYTGVNHLDDGGTGGYNGLLLSTQKRLSNNTSVLANYTWSHCISDYWQSQVGTATATSIPGNRRAFRSNCQTGDQRQIFTLSVVAQTPKFSSRPLRLLASGWQFSPIMKIESAQFFSATLGVDNALTGQPTQAPNLVGDPYPAAQSVTQWITRSAFQTPTTGTYGTMPLYSLKGPGIFQLDLALSRIFQIGEKRALQLRGEAFNLPNHLNPGLPVAALNNTTAFGQIQSDISGTSGLTAGDPRIIQVAVKFIF